jgi:hypothetical protein
MATSEAHGESIQQTIHFIKIGRLPCSGNSHPLGVDLIDHSPFSAIIRGRLALGDRVSLLVMEN